MYHNAQKHRQPLPHAEQRMCLKNVSSSDSSYFNIIFLFFILDKAFTFPQLIISLRRRAEGGGEKQNNYTF